jgi:Ala-tRNA(Pro) deacylase
VKVAELLKTRNVDFELLPHPATFDAQRLAQVLHVSGRRVAKTVLLKACGGYRYFVAVLPAHKSINLAKVASSLGGGELRLASEAEVAAHCPDCEAGVLPPFGSSYAMQTLADHSLRPDDEIIFEGNCHREAVRMKFGDLCQIEHPLILELTD